MADLTIVSSKVGVTHPESAVIYTLIAAAAINAGQPVYINSNGKADLSDGNGSAPANTFRGIALQSVGAGQAVAVLISGFVDAAGLGAGALAYNAAIYVSDTGAGGTLADAAGTTSLLVGRVVPLADGSLTKVVYVMGFAG